MSDWQPEDWLDDGSFREMVQDLLRHWLPYLKHKRDMYLNYSHLTAEQKNAVIKRRLQESENDDDNT